MGCCACVEESRVGMIESFGKYSRVATPGCNYLNCCTERIAGHLSLRVEQHKVNVETRTKDNVFVTIKMAIQLKVAENETEFPTGKKGKGKEKMNFDEDTDTPVYSNKLDKTVLYNAYYKLNQPIAQILAYLEEFFRFHGMEYTLDDMFAAKNDMTKDLHELLNEKMNPYGFLIKHILVIDIDPDPKVKSAMNDIIASEKEKRAQQSRAEAEKITRILAAEADAKTRELAGEGVANARKAIVRGLQESVEVFKKAIPDTDPNQVLMTVLMTQYLDTIKEAGMHGSGTFLMPTSPAQIATMEDQLRQAIHSGDKKNK